MCEWTPNLLNLMLDVVLKGSTIQLRQLLLENWQSGLTYMMCVLLILLLHEFGHFWCHDLLSCASVVSVLLAIPF